MIQLKTVESKSAGPNYIIKELYPAINFKMKSCRYPQNLVVVVVATWHSKKRKGEIF